MAKVIGRKKVIEIAARNRGYSDRDTPDQKYCFIEGCEWSDQNPDQEIISKFTSNLIDENRKQFKMLNVAMEALKTAHENACNCCNSNEDVKVHCDEALEKMKDIKNG